MDDSYNYVGMHFYWWVLWIIVLIWIFVTPYNIPGQRLKRDSPLDILQKRLALGEIDNSEYLEKKELLKEKNRPKAKLN